MDKEVVAEVYADMGREGRICPEKNEVTHGKVLFSNWLAKMELLRRGSRLSVQPVTEKEFEAVLKLAQNRHRPKPQKVAKTGK